MRSSTKGDSVFGHIDNIPVGKTWRTRAECGNDGVHRPLIAGIWGSEEDGAWSVVLSGVYEDDVDEGDIFIYTGDGGREGYSGPQTHDQSEDTPGNKRLLASKETGNVVRVVRGSGVKSVYAPVEGYRYDGLYGVEDAWKEKGKSGYIVFRYRFERCLGQPPIPRRDNLPEPVAGPSKAKARASNSSSRIKP